RGTSDTTATTGVRPSPVADRARGIQDPQELRIQGARSFGRTRELLRKEGVPFEPDELLDPNWRGNLTRAFEKLHQLQEDRVVSSSSLKGVYIANRLSLPEKWRADSDVVILARHLLYAGKNVEIIAPGHDVSVYVLDSEEKLVSRGNQRAEDQSVPTVFVRTGAADLPNRERDRVKPRTAARVGLEGRSDVFAVNAMWSRTTSPFIERIV